MATLLLLLPLLPAMVSALSTTVVTTVVDTVCVAASSGTTSCTPPLAASSEPATYGFISTTLPWGEPSTTGDPDANPMSSSDTMCASTPNTSTTTTTKIATTPASGRISAAALPTTPSPKTTSAQPTDFAVMEDCFETQGGLQLNNALYSGCGAIFQHIVSCYEKMAPWTDPYNTTQSAEFQACICGTSVALPYSTNGVLFQNYTACSNCLYDFAHVSLDDVTKEIERIDNFCCAEFPNAFLFLQRLQDWVNRLHGGVQLSKEPFSALLINSLAQLWTTTPPLLNVAYGASAAGIGGSLAGVTPSLTTATYTSNGNDSAVTSLVTWLPTALSASISAGANLEGALSSGMTAVIDQSDVLGAAATQGGPSQNCHGARACAKSVGSAASPALPWLLASAMAVGMVLSV